MTKVKRSVRQRVHHHLENPPDECLCHKSKSVDRLRRKLADMTKEDEEGAS